MVKKMTDIIIFFKLFFIGELIIGVSAIPHFFMKKIPRKIIVIICILFSIIWIIYSIYLVYRNSFSALTLLN